MPNCSIDHREQLMTTCYVIEHSLQLVYVSCSRKSKYFMTINTSHIICNSWKIDKIDIM